jgi:hypothetical protein
MQGILDAFPSMRLFCDEEAFKIVMRTPLYVYPLRPAV